MYDEISCSNVLESKFILDLVERPWRENEKITNEKPTFEIKCEDDSCLQVRPVQFQCSQLCNFVI